jgi:hypothetical protein
MKYVAYATLLLVLVSSGIWIVYWKLLKIVWSGKRPLLNVLFIIIANTLLLIVVALVSDAFDSVFHIFP